MPPPRERIDSVKWIGEQTAENIYALCGGTDIPCVLKKLGESKTQEELREMLHKCCANKRGGQTIKNSQGEDYLVPMYNERSIIALLGLLLERNHYLKHLQPAKVKSMLQKVLDRRAK